MEETQKKDTLIKAMTHDGSVRATCCLTTQAVEQARHYHNTTPVMTAALGRTLTAASMMGSMLKGVGESVTIRITSDGPAKSILCIGNSDGMVWGCTANPYADLPLNSQGKLDVGGVIGRGTLSVIKDMKLSQPYTGQVPLVSGEIAEDITSYFAVSEQIPTVCSLGVLIDRDRTVKVSGGFILQLMPFASEREITQLEDSVRNMRPITELISGGMSAEDVLRTALRLFEVDVFDQFEIGYRCNCSKLRAEKVLMAMGRDELIKLCGEQEVTEVTCRFCDKIYKFTADDLNRLIKHGSK